MIAPSAAKQPNVILLVMDSVRAANLSCYGYARPTTPHIDALAREGTLYEKAISVGCWTLPVHATLFTGLYPLNHGVTISRDALPSSYPTLAAQLKAHGYRTACFSNNPYIGRATGLGTGFDTLEELWTAVRPRGHRRTKMGRLIKYLEGYGAPAKPAIAMARSLQKARAMVKRRRNTRDSGAAGTNERIRRWLDHSSRAAGPFFMFVNYMECHEPYAPPSPYDRKFMPAQYSPWRVARLGTNKNVLAGGSETARRENLEILQALYDGELNYLDARLGELIADLRRRGLLDNTLLVVTADHGDSLGEHDQIGHRVSLFEQLVHVPLVIRWPERFAAGARVAEQVQLIDLHATLLDAAAVPLGERAGKGAQSLLGTAPGRRVAIAENTAPKAHGSILSRMVRTDRYKLIWNSNQRHELYDLHEDPAESRNLAQSHAETVAQLEQQLDAWRQSLEADNIQVAEAEYDEAVLARLRDLGYVD